MAKIVCVLYPDPLDGYPSAYPRASVPRIERYPGGQTAPTPRAVDFTPGQLLGSVLGELGLRRFLEAAGHTFVVTSDKDGPDSVFERELVDADVVISQPFWPAYLTAERIAKAPKLRLAVTAGIGSDHVDLAAAMQAGLTVAEVTYSNSISVSEHVVMMILALVRNYIPSHEWVVRGGWNIADCVERSYDLEGMAVGHGRGRPHRPGRPPPSAALRRGAPLHRPPPSRPRGRARARAHLPPRRRVLGEGVRRRHHQRAAPPRDRAPLRRRLIGRMKPRLVPREHGPRQDLRPRRRRPALESGQLAGYAGDVWFPQPAPTDHPWRTMPHEGMTPHISDRPSRRQARYAAGTREILECFFEGRSIRDEYLIVDGGRLAGSGAHSYSEGDATVGSEELSGS